MHMFQQYFTILFLAEVRGFIVHWSSLKIIVGNSGPVSQCWRTGCTAVGGVLSRFVEVLQCAPLCAERGLQLRDAYHPLLADPVPNSITVRIAHNGDRVKYVRKIHLPWTVGLNALMAQTVATCTAEAYQASPVGCSRLSGVQIMWWRKSYYLEEALSVLRVIEVVDDGAATLVIFDELYRGTNSEERSLRSVC